MNKPEVTAEQHTRIWNAEITAEMLLMTTPVTAVRIGCQHRDLIWSVSHSIPSLELSFSREIWDGWSCPALIQPFFVAVGYIEAAVIPAGARRIRVVEDKPAHSFLGKKTKEKKNVLIKI